MKTIIIKPGYWIKYGDHFLILNHNEGEKFIEEGMAEIVDKETNQLRLKTNK